MFLSYFSIISYFFSISFIFSKLSYQSESGTCCVLFTNLTANSVIGWALTPCKNVIKYVIKYVIVISLSLRRKEKKWITKNFPYKANKKLVFSSWGLNGACYGPIKFGRVMPPLSLFLFYKLTGLISEIWPGIKQLLRLNIIWI